MVEANHNVQQAQLRASMGMAVTVLARQRAIRAVKQALAAKGLKPQHIAKREIVREAREYLVQQPDPRRRSRLLSNGAERASSASELPSKILSARGAETATKSASAYAPKQASDNN